MPDIQWTQMFTVTVHPVEIVIRGSAIYLSLFLMMRFVLKRQAGAVNITDLLFVVLVADASQNAMAGEYRSILDGLLLVAVLLFWDYLLDWAALNFPSIERLLQPPPLLLVRHGVLQKRNLRAEMVSEQELMAEIRQQGLQHLHEVKLAYMEHNGHISVIPMKKD